MTRATTVPYILVSGLLGVAGQVIMKQGVAAVNAGHPSIGLLNSLPDLVLNPLVAIGLVVYGIGTLFWLMALSRVDLSYAYPFASLNYLFVLLASWWFLDEQLSPWRIVGVVSIGVGVYAVSRTPDRTVAQPGSAGGPQKASAGEVQV